MIYAEQSHYNRYFFLFHVLVLSQTNYIWKKAPKFILHHPTLCSGVL